MAKPPRVCPSDPVVPKENSGGLATPSRNCVAIKISRQGLLGYALSEEGLVECKAARDGKILMSGWLAYGGRRFRMSIRRCKASKCSFALAMCNRTAEACRFRLSGGLLAPESSFTLSLETLDLLVGAGRFERPTPCAQGRCATRLRYAPTFEASLILNHFLNFRNCPACPNREKMLRPWQNRDKTSSVGPHRVKTRTVLIGLPVQLLQSLAFHLQFHLRVLLKHLRIALPQQLGDPLVRHAPRA